MAREGRSSCCRSSVGSRPALDRRSAGFVRRAQDDLGLGVLPARELDRLMTRSTFSWNIRARGRHCARASSPMHPSHHLLLHGTEGSFVKYGMDPQEEILRSPNCPDGLDWGKDWGLEPEERWGTLSPVNETAAQSEDRARRLPRVLRQRQRCDREKSSARCDARASPAHHASTRAGAQKQPRRPESPVDRSARVTSTIAAPLFWPRSTVDVASFFGSG